MPEIFIHSEKYPVTPDGRYFVVRGRLWRCSNPKLGFVEQDRLMHKLMKARKDVLFYKKRGNADGEAQAHADVNTLKIALGERGPVWWNDGAPDYTRHKPATTPYAEWYENLKIADADEAEPA